MPQPILEVRGLGKRFGRLEVLQGIDLSVSQGEVVALIGPSGSGKLTLLRCINGLEMPTIGRRSGFRGVDISGADANLNRVRREIGMVFQRFNLFPISPPGRTSPWRLRQVLGPLPRRGGCPRRRAARPRFPGSKRPDAYPSALSGGQQQRVAIARALAMQPASCCSTSRRRRSTRSWSARCCRHPRPGAGGDDNVRRHARDGVRRGGGATASCSWTRA